MTSPPGNRIGLIGDPVEHSLSPAFQQPAFDALGLDIRYELWHTTSAQLPGRLDELRAGRARGANVTVPHKESAFALMDDVSDVARRAGAVNTIVPRDGTLFGDNTDVHGFIVPLRERGVAFDTLDAVIIGAGGAARGVAVSLLDAGVHSLTILNRTRARAETIVATLSDVRLRAGALDDANVACVGAGLIVNATSLGWNAEVAPLDVDTMARAAPDAIACDLTYRETPFLRSARAAGLAALDGLAMLVHQGARSLELWTGREAPVDLMWQAALAARAAQGG